MTAPAFGAGAAGATATPPSWHDDALRLGAALDHVAAALVVGRDGDAAAWAALGAARAQAARRRVAVADLVGDAPALADVGDGDEPVGLSDSFFYGVTLNKIARPVDASDNLFVLPSGSEPVAVEEILSSDRWRRLVGGFREAGALLVLAAQADAPGLDALAAQVDGLVVVGDLGGLLPDAPAPLMVIPSPTPRARAAARAAAPAGVPNVAEPAGAQDAPPAAGDGARPTFAEEFARITAPAAATPAAATPAAATSAASAPAADVRAADAEATSTPVAAAPATSSPEFPRRPASTPRTAAAVVAAEPPARGGRRAALIGAAVLAAAAVGALVWARRPAPNVTPNDAGRAARPAAAATGPADSAARAPGAAPAGSRDSAGGATAVPPARPGDLAAALAVRNPADSARAAAYAVYLVGANTPEGAALPSGVDPASVPGPALTPQLEDGAPWWRLLVGAYPTRQRAEAALAELRTRGALGASSGAVVRAPYALLVADALPAAQAPARVEALARRGVPTYPLARADGTVALYAGAFERPEDAAYLAQALQAAGVAPALVYRTGTAEAGAPAGGAR